MFSSVDEVEKWVSFRAFISVNFDTVKHKQKFIWHIHNNLNNLTVEIISTLFLVSRSVYCCHFCGREHGRRGFLRLWQAMPFDRQYALIKNHLLRLIMSNRYLTLSLKIQYTIGLAAKQRIVTQLPNMLASAMAFVSKFSTLCVSHGTAKNTISRITEKSDTKQPWMRINCLNAVHWEIYRYNIL